MNFLNLWIKTCLVLGNPPPKNNNNNDIKHLKEKVLYHNNPVLGPYSRSLLDNNVMKISLLSEIRVVNIIMLH